MLNKNNKQKDVHKESSKVPCVQIGTKCASCVFVSPRAVELVFLILQDVCTAIPGPRTASRFVRFVRVLAGLQPLQSCASRVRLSTSIRIDSQADRVGACASRERFRLRASPVRLLEVPHLEDSAPHLLVRRHVQRHDYAQSDKERRPSCAQK
jgi:hypothetical protein